MKNSKSLKEKDLKLSSYNNIVFVHYTKMKQKNFKFEEESIARGTYEFVKYARAKKIIKALGTEGKTVAYTEKFSNTLEMMFKHKKVLYKWLGNKKIESEEEYVSLRNK